MPHSKKINNPLYEQLLKATIDLETESVNNFLDALKSELDSLSQVERKECFKNIQKAFAKIEAVIEESTVDPKDEKYSKVLEIFELFNTKFLFLSTNKFMKTLDPKPNFDMTIELIKQGFNPYPNETRSRYREEDVAIMFANCGKATHLQQLKDEGYHLNPRVLDENDAIDELPRSSKIPHLQYCALYAATTRMTGINSRDKNEEAFKVFKFLLRETDLNQKLLTSNGSVILHEAIKNKLREDFISYNLEKKALKALNEAVNQTSFQVPVAANLAKGLWTSESSAPDIDDSQSKTENDLPSPSLS